MMFGHFHSLLKLLLAATLALVLSSCGFAGDENHARVTVVEDSKTAINPVGTRLNFASATMRAAMAKGLVGFDDEGRVVPALAARWIVTDDGLSYIFRLYDAKWDDGRKITAERIAKLLRQRLDELAGSRLMSDVLAVDEVISMTGSVIEIRLDSPHPNFLQLLAQPEMGLFRAGHGAGPMRLLNEENGLTLGMFEEPSATDGEEQPKEDPRRVWLRSDTAARAITRFNQGQTDLVLNGKFDYLPLIEQAGIDSDDIRLDPVAGLFGFLFISADGFWSVPKNREILSMAINRPALLTSFPSVSAWKVRLKIIPEALDVEGIDARPDWSATTMEARRAFARQYVANWKASDGLSIKPLTVDLPDTAGANILFLRIRADLRRVGLDLRRASKNAKADARLIDEIAPYDSAQWFLTRLTCAQTAVCLNDADAKIAEADAANDLQIKARLYAEAEVALVGHYNYIPLAVPVRWSIVRPGQRGFAVNSRGWHPLNTLVGIPIS